MTDRLERATITQVDRTTRGSGRNRRTTDRDTDQSVTLDFNPETLTIKIQNATEKKGQKANQRVQYVGSSFATLSFDAIFDHTRPSEELQDLVQFAGQQPGGSTAMSLEALDVRQRTRVLAGLLDGQSQSPTSSGSGTAGRGQSRTPPFPKLVRFDWGAIHFLGYVESYQEVLDFFSPNGVPLRAKVSLTLTEQSARYHVNGDDRPRWDEQVPPAAPPESSTGNPGAGGPGGDAPSPDAIQDALDALGAGLDAIKDIASLNGLSDLLDVGLGGSLSIGLDLGLDLGFDVGLSLGVGVDLGLSSRAGVDLGVDAALDVFGGDVVGAALGGSPDLSRSAPSRPERPITTNKPGPWAPDGPAPGTRAAALATEVEVARAGATAGPAPSTSGAFTATRSAPRVPSAADAPTPVRGTPPKVLPAFGPPPPGALFGRVRAVPTAGGDVDRPSWERSPKERLAPASAKAHTGGTGCGCGCGGRRRW